MTPSISAGPLSIAARSPAILSSGAASPPPQVRDPSRSGAMLASLGLPQFRVGPILCRVDVFIAIVLLSLVLLLELDLLPPSLSMASNARGDTLAGASDPSPAAGARRGPLLFPRDCATSSLTGPDVLLPPDWPQRLAAFASRQGADKSLRRKRTVWPMPARISLGNADVAVSPAIKLTVSFPPPADPAASPGMGEDEAYARGMVARAFQRFKATAFRHEHYAAAGSEAAEPPAEPPPGSRRAGPTQAQTQTRIHRHIDTDTRPRM